ncbi:hypothetical protein D7Y13_33455 [Corallococcus praedator]|uniref:Uncharacterized protein n=2 Tax=Myxococcaceae TaxID=31 RepID=A0ABX9Q7Z2_9BACT|nr:hypothetical protein D7X74_27420 [Corallococcus sp. CA047B]RKH31702.1 hypothetical protein D7X75_18425 [Corallococcus sp. CA031C]RKH94260.1 hypothetical protein D7Y13_33455 [Corallococcus praedator]
MFMVGFIASRTGRWVRILAGSGLVLGGLGTGSPRGAMVALTGLVPLLSGALDLFLLGPLFGLPVRGADVRRALGQPEEAPLLDLAHDGGRSPYAPPSTLLH